jgi:hypothetical protein
MKQAIFACSDFEKCEPLHLTEVSHARYAIVNDVKRFTRSSRGADRTCEPTGVDQPPPLLYMHRQMNSYLVLFVLAGIVTLIGSFIVQPIKSV